jgi:hypothetical protein
MGREQWTQEQKNMEKALRNKLSHELGASRESISEEALEAEFRKLKIAQEASAAEQKAEWDKKDAVRESNVFTNMKMDDISTLKFSEELFIELVKYIKTRE